MLSSNFDYVVIDGEADGGGGDKPTVSFEPAAGKYATTQSVTLTSEGADHIYYTTDGTAPSDQSAEYSTAISVSETTTIKAFAVKGEVTGDVAHAMEAVFRTEETEDILLRTDELHWLCDLPAACWHTLRGAGIPGDSIHFSGLCTWENPEWLFSHRRSSGKRGNFNTFIGIKEV